MLSHALRQATVWLTFDVRQKNMKTLLLSLLLVSWTAAIAETQRRVASPNSDAYLQRGSADSPGDETFGVFIGKTQAILIIRNGQLHSFVVLPASEPGFTVSKEGEDTYILFTKRSGPVVIPFDGVMFGPDQKVAFVDKAYLEKIQGDMREISILLEPQK
jgi:hypothetical protein